MESPYLISIGTLARIFPLLALFRRDRRSIHDLLAGTRNANTWRPGIS